MEEEVNVQEVSSGTKQNAGKSFVENEVESYRLITTFNAQLTKWTFLLCGVVIGWLINQVW